MVHLRRESLNTHFDTLEEWNTYLKAEDFDPKSIELQSDNRPKPVKRGRHHEFDRTQSWRKR